MTCCSIVSELCINMNALPRSISPTSAEKERYYCWRVYSVLGSVLVACIDNIVFSRDKLVQEVVCAHFTDEESKLILIEQYPWSQLILSEPKYLWLIRLPSLYWGSFPYSLPQGLWPSWGRLDNLVKTKRNLLCKLSEDLRWWEY